MAIAIYLRLSQADGDLGIDGKDESNSIENQRTLLHNYIETREDLEGEIIEYADDGFTGTNFDRPSFKRMIEDAKKRKIQVILVKDLSRLGRDYIMAGDYIEQIFPMLQVRFIAVNNGYDSAKQNSRNMGFDIAVSNLVNTFYSRDLSRKLRSANEIRWKNGICTSGHAPFGYVKSSDEKGKYLIDPEAAKIVRFIFDQALEGKNTAAIAAMLNENKYPTPGVYDREKKLWKLKEPITAEKERLWDTSKVSTVIRRYDYTGAMVIGRKRNMSLGSKRKKVQPLSKRIIVEGIHEPIVTHEEYERANRIIQEKRQRDYVVGQDYMLKGKARCGNCMRCLSYEITAHQEYFLCRHGKESGKQSECCTEQYPVKHIDEVVWNAIKELLFTLESLGVKARNKAKEQMKAAKAIRKTLDSEIEKLKAEKLRQYEFYADGVITREQYIHKKAELNDRIQELESESKGQAEKYDCQSELLESATKMNSLVTEFSGEKKLSRKMVMALIESVYIYDPKRIEIVFQHEDELVKLVESLQVQADNNC